VSHLIVFGVIFGNIELCESAFQNNTSWGSSCWYSNWAAHQAAYKMGTVGFSPVVKHLGHAVDLVPRLRTNGALASPHTVAT